MTSCTSPPASRASTLIVGMLAVFFAGATPAHSSCLRVPIHRTVLPADGATGFPTNGRILVLLDRWPPEIRARMAEEFRLLTPDGTQVELRGEVEGTVLTLTPTRALAPLETYVLESVYAYGDGRLLSDEERWRYAGGLGSGRAQGPDRPTVFSRTWFPTASFRTGEGPDARVPPQPTLLKAIYATERDSVTVQVTMEDPPDLAEGDLVAFEVKGQGIVWRSPHKAWPAELAPPKEGSPQRIASVGDGACSQEVVHIDASEAPEVRTIAISVSGTVSARGPWAPAVRQGGEGHPAGHPVRRAETTYPWLVEAFFAPPVQQAPAVLPEGPPGCPHGLIATSTSVLPEYHWNQGVDGRGFALVGEQGWLLVGGQEEREASLALLDPQAKPTQVIPLGDRRAVARPVRGDPPVVLATREDPGGIRVWRPGDGTTPGWERLLAEGEVGSGPFMVTGDERVLVGWTRQRRVGDIRESWPFWAILDAATGRSVGEGDLGDFGPVTSVEALGWDGRGFLLQWDWVRRDVVSPGEAADLHRGPEEGAWFARISPEGGLETPLRLPSARRVQQILPTSGGWVVAWYGDGMLEVAWLDARADILSGPWALGAGVMEGFQDMATHGDLVVITGGGRYGADAVVVVLDREGRLSPPARLGGGLPALDPVIEASGDGFLVAHGTVLYPYDPWVVSLERLECRTDRPLGPPPALAPSGMEAP